jgi:large subunit ribosomal protein L4
VSSVDVINAEGTKAGSVELPGDIFDVQANIPLMHQVVVAQLAAARQGTAKAKTRGEVAGGGKNGPVPRDYSQRTPKKMKAAALRGALSDRARDGRVHVVESFIAGETPSTKAAVATLRKATESNKVLVVLSSTDELNWLSLRNETTVHLIEAGQLNTYDVLVADEVVFTKDALDEFCDLGSKTGGQSLGVPAEASEEGNK